jgi:hypothetical protein
MKLQTPSELQDAFMKTVSKYAGEYNLDKRILAPCVQKIILGDEAGARMYLRDLARGYEQFKSFTGATLAEGIELHDTEMSAKETLYELLDDGELDALETAKNLVQFISEDDARRYMQIYEINQPIDDEEDTDEYAGF